MSTNISYIPRQNIRLVRRIILLIPLLGNDSPKVIWQGMD